MYGLRIIFVHGFADFCILAHHLFTLSIPPTWRNDFTLSLMTSLHLMYGSCTKGSNLRNQVTDIY